MVFKKIFGYVLIAIGLLIALSAVGTFVNAFKSLLGFLAGLSGKGDVYNTSRQAGYLFGYSLMVALAVVSIKTGARWVKSRPAN